MSRYATGEPRHTRSALRRRRADRCAGPLPSGANIPHARRPAQYLARDGAYDDLNMPLREALRHRMEVGTAECGHTPTAQVSAPWLTVPDDQGVPRRERACGRQDVFEGVHTCTDDETLASLFKTIERSSFHR